MSQIHEELPYSSFDVPAGIVVATVCSRSGKQPIEGLCGGTLMQEYFEEGTVPTESCDVHYAGTMCAIDGCPATELCPFKAAGVFELTPEVPPALQSGFVNYSPTNSAYTTVTDENGVETRVLNQCHHTVEFMTQPNIADIIALEQANAVAAAEAAQAAAAAAGAPPAEAAPAPAEQAAPDSVVNEVPESVAAGN